MFDLSLGLMRKRRGGLPNENLLLKMLAGSINDSVGGSTREVEPLQYGLFNGVLDYVNTELSNELQIPSTGYLKAECCFNLTSLPTVTAIMGQDYASGLYINVDSAGLVKSYLDGQFISISGVVAGQTHFLSTTYNNGTHSIDLDGATNENTATLENVDTSPLYFGRGFNITKEVIGSMYDIKLWAGETEESAELVCHFSHPTMLPDGTAVWFNLAKPGEYVVASVLDPAAHCASGLDYGTDTLNQDGYSDHENLIRQITYYATDSTFSDPDSDGFIGVTKDTASSAVVPVECQGPELAESATYSGRVILKAISGAGNRCVINFSISQYMTGEIVSGPGTITGSGTTNGYRYMIVTGLSETEETVVDVHNSTFEVGVDTVKLNIVPDLLAGWTPGNGCKMKSMQICEGDTITEYTSTPNTVLARYPKTKTVPITSIKRMVTYGDSLTNTYPSILRGIFPETTIHRTNEGGMRSDWLENVFQERVLDYAPEHLILLAGSNDFAQGYSFEHVQSYMMSMITQALSAGITLTLATCPPRGNSSSWAAEQDVEMFKYNSWLISYCDENGIECLDLYSLVVEPGTVNIATEYDSGDGVHMNYDGYTVLAHALARRVTPVSFVAGDASRSILQNTGRVKYDLVYDSDNDKYYLPSAPELITALGLDSDWFDSDGLGVQYSLAEWYAFNGFQVFGSTGKEHLAIYSVVQVDPALTKILDYMGNS
jgi:lysophospholipase L1-like esterase